MIEWVEGFRKFPNTDYNGTCWSLMVNGRGLARIDGPCAAREGFWAAAWRKPSPDLESAKLRVLKEGRIGLRHEIKRLKNQLEAIETCLQEIGKQATADAAKERECN